MRFCAQTTLCLLTILVAAKGRGITQLRYQKREKAASLPKISINIFDVFKGVGGGGVERGSREQRTIDVSCEQNRYVRRPLLFNSLDNLLHKQRPLQVRRCYHIYKALTS